MEPLEELEDRLAKAAYGNHDEYGDMVAVARLVRIIELEARIEEHNRSCYECNECPFICIRYDELQSQLRLLKGE